MNGDIYVRDGSRFKKVPNMVGMYYNGITFTKEQMQDTIGVVVDQKYDRVVICAINPSGIRMTWDNAKKWCEKQFDGKGKMPEINELVVVRKFIDKIPIWLWSNTECDSSLAKGLDLYNGYVYDYDKVSDYYVFAFLDIPIIDIM